jgi:hypothetical protein
MRCSNRNCRPLLQPSSTSTRRDPVIVDRERRGRRRHRPGDRYLGRAPRIPSPPPPTSSAGTRSTSTPTSSSCAAATTPRWFLASAAACPQGPDRGGEEKDGRTRSSRSWAEAVARRSRSPWSAANQRSTRGIGSGRSMAGPPPARRGGQGTSSSPRDARQVGDAIVGSPRACRFARVPPSSRARRSPRLRAREPLPAGGDSGKRHGLPPHAGPQRAGPRGRDRLASWPRCSPCTIPTEGRHRHCAARARRRPPAWGLRIDRRPHHLVLPEGPRRCARAFFSGSGRASAPSPPARCPDSRWLPARGRRRASTRRRVKSIDTATSSARCVPPEQGVGARSVRWLPPVAAARVPCATRSRELF